MSNRPRKEPSPGGGEDSPATGTASLPRFSLNSHQISRITLATIVGVVGLILALAASAAYERFRETVSNAYALNSSVSHVLSGHMLHVLSSAEALQSIVAERVEARGLHEMTAPAETAFVRRLVDLFPAIAYLVVLDGEGNPVVQSHAAETSWQSHAGRDYFLKHQEGAQVVLGEPTRSRTAGKDVFTLSQALRNAAGELRAVVVVAIDRSYFARLFFQRGNGDTVTALREDGVILTRYPQVPMGEKLPSNTLVLNLLRRANEGNYEAISPIDGERRYFSYSKVEDYPVYLLVSRRKTDVLLDWQNEVSTLSVVLLGAMTALLLAGRALFNALRKEETTRAHLEESQRFQLAILDSVSAHIAIVAPDGTILATNRAWRLFGLRNGLPEGEAVEGSNYFEACENVDHEDARTALAGISGVMSGATKEFQLDYACHAPDEYRWFTMKVTPLVDGRRAVLVSHENVTRLMEAKQALRTLAETDPLTGLANRRRFFEDAEHHFMLASQHHKSLSIIVVDCDHFKRVNDNHGHEVGDQVLVAMAKALLRSVRKKDLVARIGGEEFAVLLPDTDLEGAYRVAQHVRAAVLAHPGPVRVTISAGVAAYRRDMENVAELLRAADTALYTAKHEGRDRIEVERTNPEDSSTD